MYQGYHIIRVSLICIKKSAIPAMKRILNEEDLKMKKALKSIVSVPRELRFFKTYLCENINYHYYY